MAYLIRRLSCRGVRARGASLLRRSLAAAGVLAACSLLTACSPDVASSQGPAKRARGANKTVSAHLVESAARIRRALDVSLTMPRMAPKTP